MQELPLHEQGWHTAFVLGDAQPLWELRLASASYCFELPKDSKGWGCLASQNSRG